MARLAGSLAQPDDVIDTAREGVRDAAEAAQGAAGQVISGFPEWGGMALRVGLVLAMGFVVNVLARRLIRRLARRVGGEKPDVAMDVALKRAQTLGQVLRTTASAAIWGTTLLLVLGQLRVNLGPLIAAVGIGGVAIGFGAQSLVRDVISGFFVLLEDQYHVGDVVAIAGVSGMIEGITLRTTILRDLEGRRHVVPNGEIRVSTNYTKDFSRYLINLPVRYEDDVDHVVGIVRSVAEDLRRDPAFSGDILGPLEVLGVDAYADSQVTVKVYLDTIPGRQWAAGRELRRRIKIAFDKAGVSIPFPHRELVIHDGGGARHDGNLVRHDMEPRGDVPGEGG